MKVVLNITATSKVVSMSYCPKQQESVCGIMYRIG